jgi:phosphatidylinositol alpha-1,6-mannosyltransferase
VSSLRALILTPDFPPAPGGIQLVMSRLAANLRAAEPRVVTLAFESHGPDPPSGVSVVSAGTRGWTNNKLAVARLNVAALREATRSRPDVVVSGHAVTAPGAVAVRLSRQAPVIQYVHSDEARLRPRLLRFAVRRADAVIAVSRHAQRVATDAGCRPDRVRIVPPGVDIADSGPDGGSSPASRAERPTIVTVSRLQVSYKGHDTMIRALPAIRARVPDVRWVVVGEGRLRASLERLASSLGVRDAIHFAGPVSDSERDRWLDSAHVFAMPNRPPPGGVGGEGFGIVFLEAAAHGLPVVAGAAGGALDAVADGETGVLVPPTDEGAVADAVAGLLADRERASRLGERGAARARGLTWARHAAAVEDVIREVTGK